MTDRSPTRITMTVWRALYLREAASRLFGSRAGWLWLFLEPLAHVAFISFLFSVIRQREISGIDTVLFLTLGLIGFFLFRRAANQMGGAIDGNRALFTYRQVLPFDPIIVRGFVELTIMTGIFLFTMMGLLLLEYDVTPDQPLRMALGYLALWLLGTGFGLIIAISSEVVGELRKIFNLMMMPLYFLSAVIFPINIVPPEYRYILLYNPIPHALETIRMAFSPQYISVPGIDVGYCFIWAAGFWALGLVLYHRFSYRVVAE